MKILRCLTILLGATTAFSPGKFRLGAKKLEGAPSTNKASASIFTLKSTLDKNSSISHIINNNENDKVKDSCDKYELDVTTVLKQIHPDEEDTTIPKVYRSRRLSFTNIWTLEDWKAHTSRKRYLSVINPFQISRLMRRIWPQLTVVTLWTAAVVTLGRRSPILSQIHVPFSYLSLISGFVAALQTLRTNDSLKRLKEGRVAMGNAILLTRDSAQLFAQYIYPRDAELGLFAARHLSLFCWLLKAHLRNEPETQVLQTMLPLANDAIFIDAQRKKPVALLARLRQVICNAEERQLISTAEQVRLDENIKGLEHVIMTTERLRSAPIPPVYSSNAAGLMLLYLLFLPLVFIETNLSSIVTMFMTASVGYAMLGLDEVSHMLEQPFRLMPLYQLSKISMMDVSDAFTCLPPPLSARVSQQVLIPKRPTYW